MRGWKGAFAALFVCSWAGNQFSPLLLLYREHDGYTTVAVNAFLGVYVLGLVPSLVMAGGLSDRYGRRPVMTVATFAAVATSAVLALGEWGPIPLLIGRLLAGIAVGSAMAVGTSWLKELSSHPHDLRADHGAGARRAAVAFALGSGGGALVAGLLAEWGPWPEVLPYVVHLAVAVPLLLLVPRIVETRTAAVGAEPWHRSLRIPALAHPRFGRVVLPCAPWIFGAAALSYGYLPVLLAGATRGFGIAYATALTVVALGVSAVVQPMAKRLDSTTSARGLLIACATLTVSVGVMALTVRFGSPWLGVAAAAVTGVGIGIALSCGLLEVQRIAGPDGLAGLTGVFYALAYLGFLTPTLMAAVTPLWPTLELFGALLVLGAGSTIVLLVHSRRHLPLAVLPTTASSASMRRSPGESVRAATPA